MESSRLMIVMCLSCVLACSEFEPRPDIDTGTGSEGEPDPEDNEVVYDGDGDGVILPARLRDEPEIANSPPQKRASSSVRQARLGSISSTPVRSR